jgi:hypothetical protein
MRFELLSQQTASISIYNINGRGLDDGDRGVLCEVGTDCLKQRYSTWGTRTPGGTRRHLRGYVKLKKKKYIHDKH